MARITLIKPLDQPPGKRRLLADLKAALADDRYTSFRLIVAYAKAGPILRLREYFETWGDSGKSIEAVFGLDQQGTSLQSLQLALELFDSVYVTQELGITFHPKIYLFKGVGVGRAIIGSNNLTVGGTEKNFESAIDIEFDLPEEAQEFAQIEQAWEEILPPSCPATRRLDIASLTELARDGVVLDETSARARKNGAAALGYGPGARRSGLVIKPESALPRSALGETKRIRAIASSRGAKGAGAIGAVITRDSNTPARGIAIQIKPHKNGEIFLSVTAALQNPTFFRWPFNGSTTPKRAGNPSYPQLDPDPVVNVTVYGAAATPQLILSAYPLNTVYYERNSEIRITASPLVDVVPDYSIMIMERSDDPEIDYEITIHRPDSPDYDSWFAACNQSMPGGGKAPRRFGWF